jgi:hypothetical protein
MVWDDTGVVSREINTHLWETKSQKFPHNLINANKLNVSQTFFPMYHKRFPYTKDQTLLTLFNRIESLLSIQKMNDIRRFFLWRLTKTKESVGILRCIDGKVCSIIIASRKNHFLEGYFISFDNNEKVIVYAEGQMQDVDENFKDINRISFLSVDNQRYVLNKGIEVKFHPTGYPSSYKTIVRNRLFGRQMEWNDKGEVISDVDLDIPRPWADAPKKPAAPVAMRTWTSSGGKYHIRAEYVSADENQVILKNEEGKVFPVALSELSKEDLDYVNKQLEAKPELPKSEKE